MKDSQKQRLLAVTGQTEIPAISEGIESTANGYIISEDGLTRIAESLESAEAAAATNAEVVTANSTLADNLAAAQQELGAANETIEANNTRIQELEARVAELEEESPITQTKRQGDPGKKEKVPFHASAENPMNKLADSLLGAPKKTEE